MKPIGKLTVRCACGSDQFLLQDLDAPGEPPKPGGRVRCGSCGAIAQLPKEDELAQAAKKAVTDAFRQAIKKR